jgi:hypothetical protein
MKTLLAGLGSLLLASTSLIGCAADASSDEDCLPGDADCNDKPLSDGKADGFDDKNDPAAMSQHLVYYLDQLPMRGWRNEPAWKSQFPEAVGVSATAWADTYWPSGEGSHNHRWQGATVKSPLEKYDAAFNNAPGCATMPSAMYGADSKAQWTTYNQCAGPAAKWQTESFQDIGIMHNGIDDDGDGKTDDRGTDGIDGIQGWWGTCHAWAPSSQMVPEPQHSVTVNGVTFDVGDIKALIQNSFDYTAAVMLGGRCNSKMITHDVNGSANDECSDVNPGALHVVMTNFLGINQLPLVEDRTANYEVWNQPVLGYEITKQEQVDATKANACVGQMGSTWTYNTNASKLYEVSMTVSYVTESSAGNTPHGYENFKRTDTYHYILEVGSTGKVIGGRYCSDNSDRHIDFLWAPTGAHDASNPHVDVAKVNELIKKSVTRM